MRGYDGIPEHEDILLDLSLSEGNGLVVRDQAKPHHEPIEQNDPGGGTFNWVRALTEEDGAFNNDFDWGLDAKIGIGCLDFEVVGSGPTDGVYLDLASANCVDLNFTSGDYSYGVWIKVSYTTQSQILIGRYQLNIEGYEIYWTKVGAIRYLTQRHHHAGTLVGGNPRSACYSVGWDEGEWHFLGISRTGGGEGLHYRNGIVLPMVTGGLVDPETSAEDLIIGARFTKDINWFKGQMWRPRMWGRALSATDWLQIFEEERDYFGV